ncbi:hypothetical protein [Levilactobacillus brevis]|uniref:hypothetical protein n=1 Tax=Levilactobacillus brevis TaxID=1580 RepID=UPI00339C2E05
MTAGQKAFRRFVLRSFEEHQYDLGRTLTWCERHYHKLSEPERIAMNHLSVKERNEVLLEIINMGLAKH